MGLLKASTSVKMLSIAPGLVPDGLEVLVHGTFTAQQAGFAIGEHRIAAHELSGVLARDFLLERGCPAAEGSARRVWERWRPARRWAMSYSWPARPDLRRRQRQPAEPGRNGRSRQLIHLPLQPPNVFRRQDLFGVQEDPVLVHPAQLTDGHGPGQLQPNRFAGGNELAALDLLSPRDIHGGRAQQYYQKGRNPKMQATLHERIPPTNRKRGPAADTKRSAQALCTVMIAYR